MARRLRYGTGAMSVEMDDTMSKIARAAIERVQPGLLDELEDIARETHDDARKRWPVDTGESRAALDYGVRVVRSGTQVEAYVSNDAPHTRYIRSRKITGLGEWDGEKNPFALLVRKPLQSSAKELAERLADAALEALEEGAE